MALPVESQSGEEAPATPLKAIATGLASTLIAGIAILVAIAVSSNVGVRDGLILSFYMLAAAAGASVLGLVFGIPRSREGFEAGESERYSSNSNLEEISDWLTKLLVGAGLVQLTQLPEFLVRLSSFLAAGLQVAGSEALSVVALLFGGGIGFVAGYVTTRLRMRLFLEASDRMAAEASRVRDIVEHLRRQNRMSSQIEPSQDLNRAATSAVRARKQTKTRRIAPILWVDDVPDNNSALIDSFRSLDIEVVLATSTAEGLSCVGRRNFGLVITDLGRQEGETYNPQAGLELIEAIRQTDEQTPVFVFGTYRAMESREQLLTAGATLVTNRASVLFEEATRRVTHAE